MNFIKLCFNWTNKYPNYVKISFKSLEAIFSKTIFYENQNYTKMMQQVKYVCIVF